MTRIVCGCGRKEEQSEAKLMADRAGSERSVLSKVDADALAWPPRKLLDNAPSRWRRLQLRSAGEG